MSSRVLTTLGVVLCALVVTVAAAAAPVTAGTTAQPHPQQSQPPVEGEVDIDPSDLPGDGTESNPYEISNVSELQAMEDDLDANYELVSDIDASQTAQFNDGRGFDPVGGTEFRETTPPPFTGSFEGNDHTITGLTINRPDQSAGGVFGFSRGTITNVTLTDITIVANTFVGGLVGFHLEGGTITNASASGSVTGTGENGDIGGLVGINSGSIQTATASGTVNGSGAAGGVVGLNTPAGTIATARSSGSVTGNESVGGLVGGNGGLIQNATASESVTGNDSVGGIVGTNVFRFVSDGNETVRAGTIQDTFAVGAVSGNADVGGLVGSNSAPGTTTTGTVEQSYFDEQATGQSASAGNATGLTTAEMQGQAAAENMNRFDFDNTWTTTSEYPALRALSGADEGSGSGSGSGGDDGSIEVDVDPSDLSGDGSESNPYEISNVSELQAMEDDLDANYELVSDIDASQTEQFNNGSGFDPTGSVNPAFSGSFDGTNNTITGLTIDRPDESNVGVFGATVGGATLADVTLVNVTVTGDRNVGGLVGSTGFDDNITDATASGNVTGESDVGGLVGFNNGGTIQNATASGSVTGNSRVGGLVGTNNGGTIQNATASGNVTGGFEVGGLVGTNNGNITDAFAVGPVTGDTNVGGLVGSNVAGPDGSGTIQDTFAVGPVSGNTEVGGLVGQNQSDTTVEQSYFDIQATGQTTSAGNATGLTTAEMQGQAAAENMALAFGETWQTVSGDYPELIALTDPDADSDERSQSNPESAQFEITLTETSEAEAVPVGEQLRVTTQITNTGSQQTEATIQLTTTAGTATGTDTDTDTQSLTLASGDSTTQTLTVDTAGVQPGTYTATVSVGITAAPSESESGSGGDAETETTTEFAVSPLEGAPGEFDTNGDGEIGITEVSAAAADFIDGDLSIGEISQIAAEFIN
uniref:GLUG domain protein n=1 Tax=uncultured haloarchaeon TaxID=160804 RepID=A0A0K1YBK8_9EURY|nr:GLUG domain protein [uncultured haloarchaeon]